MQLQRGRFEAILFFREAPRVRLSGLLEAANTALADLGISFIQEPLAGAGFAVFSHPEMHLIIAANRVPMDTADLNGAMPEDTETATALSQHRKTLRLTLGDGPHYGSTDEAAAASSVLKIKVLHRLVLALIEMERPLAVLWAQSGRILRPEAIPVVENRQIPAGLAVNALPVRQPAADGTTTEPAVAARGSELVIGRRLIVVPGPLAPAVAAPLAESLLRLEAVQPGTLAAGVTIPCSDTRHLAVADGGPGALVVRCVETLPETSAAPALPAPDRGKPATFAWPGWKAAAANPRVQVFALCAGMIFVLPIPAIALAIWNVLRGPHPMPTAMAAMAIAILSLSGIIGPSSEPLQIAEGITLR
jgi:hypothetical protein